MIKRYADSQEIVGSVLYKQHANVVASWYIKAFMAIDFQPGDVIVQQWFTAVVHEDEFVSFTEAAGGNLADYNGAIGAFTSATRLGNWKHSQAIKLRALSVVQGKAIFHLQTSLEFYGTLFRDITKGADYFLNFTLRLTNCQAGLCATLRPPRLDF